MKSNEVPLNEVDVNDARDEYKCKNVCGDAKLRGKKFLILI